jgi:ankyrin repeat protein
MSLDGHLLAVSAAAILAVAVAQSSADLDLGRAVRTDDLEGIRLALEEGANPNSDLYHYPLLNSTQSVEAAKLLLEYGADPNAGLDSTPPLDDAVSGGSIAMVELLLAAGANPDAGPHAIRCQNGVTPL